MIRCEKAEVEIVGTTAALLTDIAMIVHSLHYDVFIEDDGLSPEKSRELILNAVEKGFMDEKEAADDLKETLLNVLDKLKELLERKDDE